MAGAESVPRLQFHQADKQYERGAECHEDRAVVEGEVYPRVSERETETEKAQEKREMAQRFLTNRSGHNPEEHQNRERKSNHA